MKRPSNQCTAAGRLISYRNTVTHQRCPSVVIPENKSVQRTVSPSPFLATPLSLNTWSVDGPFALIQGGVFRLRGRRHREHRLLGLLVRRRLRRDGRRASACRTTLFLGKILLKIQKNIRKRTNTFRPGSVTCAMRLTLFLGWWTVGDSPEPSP